MELGVSYIPPHNPQHIATDIKQIKDAGCSEVLFALQENHFRVLYGAVKEGARIAKDNGLRPYVVAWGFANTFGGGRSSAVLLEKPGMWRVDKAGKPFAHACLNNGELVDEFMRLTGICRELGYEGVFVDEPTVQDCYCRICREKFRKAYKKDIRKVKKNSKQYKEFQAQTVINYTRDVCDKVKSLDSGLKTITCVMPFDSELFEQAAAIPSLDIFGTDPYWLSLVEHVKMSIDQACDYTRQAKTACEKYNKQSQVWLNCWNIKSGQEPDIYSGGKRLAAVGCDSMYTWSFRGGIGLAGVEQSQNPDLAWSYVAKLYKELSGK